MSTDEESLSKADEGLSYHVVNTQGLVSGLFRNPRISGRSA